MKLAAYTAIFLILSWAVMTIMQIWGDVFSDELYWRITITMGLIGGGIVIASLIAKEYIEDKQLKKDKFID